MKSKQEAIRLMHEGTPHERLKAVRFLSRNLSTDVAPELRKARSTEVVSYVRNGIDTALRRLNVASDTKSESSADETSISESVRKEIKSQAVEWVAGLLLHEIASPVGLAKRSAMREIPDYDESKTKSHLESLTEIFVSIEQLKGASASPKREILDFHELLVQAVSEESEKRADISVSLLGPIPMIINSDPGLLRLAVGNGLRNAIESVKEVFEENVHPIIINWGETDVDYWVSIIDCGGGLIGPVEAVFEIGKSSKKHHSGFGLAIARQAMDSLNGSVTLEPASNGGARYEARWEKI